MTYLIDTHILLWYIMGDKRLRTKDVSLLENLGNTVLLSSASLWEISIKMSIGKLKLNGSILDLEKWLSAKQIKVLEFSFQDLHTLQELPFHHQDPFDRLIVAQAMTNNLELISYDTKLADYFG